MTEREHAEAASNDWLDATTAQPFDCVGATRDERASLADLIERERAAAWLEGRNAGIDTARRVFDDMRAKDVAAARDQALEEARARLCGIEHDADYPESVSPCACAAIRELKAGR